MNVKLVERVLNIYKVACIILYLLIYYYSDRVVCQETSMAEGEVLHPPPKREEVETGNPSSEGDQTTHEDYNIVHPETPISLICYFVSNMSNTVC